MVVRDFVEHGNEREDQHERRNAKHELDEATDEDVDPTAEVAGQRTEGNTDEGSDSHGNEADANGDLRTVNHLGEDVEAALIGAKVVEFVRSAFSAEWVFWLAWPFVVAHAPIGVLINERPDGP